MKYPLKNRYIFVRHAESEANQNNIIASDLRTDTNHLTLNGRHQAMILAKVLKKEFKKADTIVSSPYLRTQETSHFIHSFFPQAQYMYDNRLGERKMHYFEGKTIHSMHSKVSSQSTLWTESMYEMEPYVDTFYRMYQWWKEYEDSYFETTCIVVSHSVPIKLLLGWFAGYRGAYLSPYFSHMNQFCLDNAEYIVISERQSRQSAHITRLPQMEE